MKRFRGPILILWLAVLAWTWPAPGGGQDPPPSGDPAASPAAPSDPSPAAAPATSLPDFARFDGAVTEAGAARGYFLKSWSEFLAALKKDQEAAAQRSFCSAFGYKLAGGFENLPEHALALIELDREHDLLKKLDCKPEGVDDYHLNPMELLAPNSAAVQLGLARYFFTGPRFDLGQVVDHYVKAAEALRTDPRYYPRAVGRLYPLPLLAVWIMGAVFCLGLLPRYLVLLHHDLAEVLASANAPRPALWILTVLVAVWPLAAGLSSWWLISWLLVVFALYMKKTELGFGTFWFLVLALAPLLLSGRAKVESVRLSPTLDSAIEVRQGAPSETDRLGLEAAYEQDPKDELVAFSLARLLQQRGELEQAYEVYLTLIERPDAELKQAVFNNLAEIYLGRAYLQAKSAGCLNRDGGIDLNACPGGMGAVDLESVEEALIEAVRLGPGSFEPNYNLYLFRYYEQGKAVSSGDVEGPKHAAHGSTDRFVFYSSFFNRYRLNRHFVAMPFPLKRFHRMLLAGSPEWPRVYDDLWRQWMGPPGGWWFYGAEGLLAAAMLGLVALRPKLRRSCRCVSCGAVIAADRGRARSSEICPPCNQAFKGTGPMDLKEKMEKRGQAQRYHDRWSWIGTVASLAVPGLGNFLVGSPLAGFGLIPVPALILAVFVSGRLMWPDPSPIPPGGLSGHVLAAAATYLLLGAVAVVVFRLTAPKRL